MAIILSGGRRGEYGLTRQTWICLCVCVCTRVLYLCVCVPPGNVRSCYSLPRVHVLRSIHWGGGGVLSLLCAPLSHLPVPKGALNLSIGAHHHQTEVGEPQDGSAENLVSLLDCFPVFRVLCECDM